MKWKSVELRCALALSLACMCIILCLTYWLPRHLPRASSPFPHLSNNNKRVIRRMYSLPFGSLSKTMFKTMSNIVPPQQIRQCNGSFRGLGFPMFFNFIPCLVLHSCINEMKHLIRFESPMLLILSHYECYGFPLLHSLCCPSVMIKKCGFLPS